jgi:hypothetical protein
MTLRSLSALTALSIVVTFPIAANAGGPVAIKKPTTITKPGSYQLVTNLSPKGSSDDAISVSASNVTIDLNGFAILGPGHGSGVGIDAPGADNATVENGTITGMGGSGVKLGDSGVVRDVSVVSNGVGNGAGGSSGIECTGSGCLVEDSVVNSNVNGFGLNFSDATSGYQHVVMLGNKGTVIGGVNMGANVCNGGTCP